MQFIRFCIVGVFGFVVDISVFHLFFNLLQVGPYFARVPSFFAAASSTWILNRHFTFKVKHRVTHTEWLLSTTSMLLGASMNYGAYALSVYYWSVVLSHPILGIAIGSLAGLAMNYISSMLIFRYLARAMSQRI